MNVTELIDAAARAAVEHQPDDLPDYLKPGSDAREFVFDRQYADKTGHRDLAKKLADSGPEFQAQVAAVEKYLAEELADNAQRIARVRAENPELFKDY